MVLICILAAVNIIAFIVYGVDKHKARNDSMRISEKTLLILAVLFGAIGAWLGMTTWHHKTKKPKFYITVPVLAILQAALIIYLQYRFRIFDFS